MTDINEETKTTAIDPVTSVLFDLEFRITTARDNLNTAEELLNQARELRKERRLQREDFEQLDSLLIVTKEFFDVVPDDLMTELYQSLKEEKENLNDTETA